MATPGIERHEFGASPAGESIERFVLTNQSGLKVALLSLGCIIQSIDAPDRDGSFANVALGFSRLEDYLTNLPFFGCIAGRFANRIAGAHILDSRCLRPSRRTRHRRERQAHSSCGRECARQGGAAGGALGQWREPPCAGAL